MSQSWGGLLGRDVIYLMPIDNLENWGGVEYDKIESVGLYGNNVRYTDLDRQVIKPHFSVRQHPVKPNNNHSV